MTCPLQLGYGTQEKLESTIIGFKKKHNSIHVARNGLKKMAFSPMLWLVSQKAPHVRGWCATKKAILLCKEMFGCDPWQYLDRRQVARINMSHHFFVLSKQPTLIIIQGAFVYYNAPCIPPRIRYHVSRSCTHVPFQDVSELFEARCD